jgi:hypothetical protein
MIRSTHHHHNHHHHFEQQIEMFENDSYLNSELHQESALEILKQKIYKHLEFMNNYLNTTNSDEFVQKLCEDMEITLKTLGTEKQQLYLNARSTSQGTQQMYNVTIDDFNSNENNNEINNLSVNNAYATPTALKIMRGFSSN